MKNLLTLIKNRDVKGLFTTPSNDVMIQLFRYVFVGGTAFVVDAGTLWGLSFLGLNAYVAVAAAFVLGLTVNFLLSKALVFRSEDARLHGAAEFLSYGVIGAIGLLLTELLVFVGLELIGLHVMVGKIVAAALVLIWNFAARKLLLYRHTDKTKETTE